jgi:hypothetical protein
VPAEPGAPAGVSDAAHGHLGAPVPARALLQWLNRQALARRFPVWGLDESAPADVAASAGQPTGGTGAMTRTPTPAGNP